MDDAENRVAVAGEILEERGVGARNAGEPGGHDERRKPARTRLWDRIRLRVRADELQGIECGVTGAKELRERADLWKPFA